MDQIFDVFGIGNPLIDLLSQVNEDILSDLQMNKGIMELIDAERRAYILNKVPPQKISPGGSCANTIIALASFGLKVVYSGGIGDDELGDQFEKGLKELDVISALKRKSLPTGSSIILITPDAERTLNTYLGACQEFSVENIDENMLKRAKRLYFTGYMWDTKNQKEALSHAVEIAENNDVEVIFDVADPFAVNRSKKDFLKIMTNHSDFVFANFAEASQMTGETDFYKVIDKMASFAPSGAIKNGESGSIVFSKGEFHEIDSFDVKAVDTTGAGDMYAAGMIYGLSRGYDLQKSGRIAAFTAAKVVEQIGARLNYSVRDLVDIL